MTFSFIDILGNRISRRKIWCDIFRRKMLTPYSEDRSARMHTAARCNALQRTATHCNALACNALQRTAMHGNTLQHTAIQCNMRQHTRQHESTQTATHCSQAFLNRSSRMYTAARCNALQHTAAHCKLLQLQGAATHTYIAARPYESCKNI